MSGLVSLQFAWVFPLVYKIAAKAPGISSAFTFKMGRKRDG